jgi:GTPase SAR1 family protein
MPLDQEKLIMFHAQRKHLGSMLSKTADITTELNMSSDSDNLDKLSTKVNNDTFKIQVIGSFKSGKSTFINSLLGEDVLPAFSWPTTAVINEVKYGESKEAILYFRNPLPENLPQSISPKALAHIKKYGKEDIPPLHIDYSELEEYVVIPMGEDAKEMLLESPYEKVELFWPLGMLKEGVEIIDSPGLNEAKTRTRVTMDYLTKADAILFVTMADKLCGMDEVDFIENNLKEFGFTDPFFIVNHFDNIPGRDKDGIVRFAKMRLSKYTTNDIFFISALQALDGQLKGDKELYEKSNMPLLSQKLSEFLTNDKGKIKLSQPARELKRIQNKTLHEVIPSQKKMLDSSLDDVKSRYEKAKPQLESLKQKKEQVMSKLRLRIEQSKHEFKRVVNQNALTVTGMIPGWIAGYTPNASLGLIPTRDKISVVVSEISDYINEKILEQQKKWRDEVMIPLVNKKSTYIFDSSEQDLTNLYNEIDSISLQISGQNNVQPKNVPVWQRIAGAAGGFLIGDLATAVAAGMTGINKELLKNVALVLGTETVLALFLGFTNPFVLVGGIAAAILGGGFKGAAAMKELKEKLSKAFVDSISQNADANSSKTANAIAEKLSCLTEEISAAIDNEIEQAKQQVQCIIQEMEEGQANIDARKRVLSTCETRIKELSTKLDAFTFELIEQK